MDAIRPGNIQTQSRNENALRVVLLLQRNPRFWRSGGTLSVSQAIDWTSVPRAAMGQ